MTKYRLLLFIIIFFPSILTADSGKFRGSYQPPFLPIVITIKEDGIDISGTTKIITPIGTFSLGYDYSLNKKISKDLILIIRNKTRGEDKLYKIKNGNDLSIFANGDTLITTENGRVIIDTTNSNEVVIQFSKEKNIKNNIVIPVEFKVIHRGNRGERFSSLYNNKKIKPSSNIKITAKSNKKSYLYVFHVKKNGILTRLFPMSKMGSEILNNKNPIKRNKKYYLPSSNLSFFLEPEKSRDALYFINLKDKDSKLESNKYSYSKSNIFFLSYINKKYRSSFNKLYFNVGN